MKSGQVKKTLTSGKTPTKKISGGASMATSKKDMKKTVKMIEGIAHVSYRGMRPFYNEVRKNIDKLQNEGLEVEVNYGCTASCFTALLIGRKEKEVK